MIRTSLVAILFALPAYALVELDSAAVPGLNEAGRQAYADFLLADLPRAFAIGSNTSAQYDDLRQLVDAVPLQTARLAFVQFADDPYAGNLTGRAALIERLRPKLGGLLVIDQPTGFTGHYGGNTARFARGYAECLRHFVFDRTPSNAC